MTKTKYINKMSKSSGDWSWRPAETDTPPLILKSKVKKKNRRSRKKRKVNKSINDNFYKSIEWRRLRHRVLERYECKCMMCGRDPKSHGVVIHVDHIRPRSKYPNESLNFDNLQLLCEDCNIGKGNRSNTDYRPSNKLATIEDIDEALDSLIMFGMVR